ncbi:hypothetical protein EP331_05810 [bacterium]|nr:MAG: hypothetical protein EP331_05810 [bacterium]
MKKKLTISFLLMSLFMLTHSAFAQFGIGVGVASSGSIITNSTTLDSEVNLAPASAYFIYKLNQLRLEGEFGLFSINSTDSEDDSYEVTLAGYTIGIGAFYTKKNVNTDFYAGARLGKIFQSETYKDDYYDDEDKRNDTFIAPTIGFEYIFDSNFAMGGEIQLNYLLIGNYNSEDTSENTITRTRSIFFIRYYF